MRYLWNTEIPLTKSVMPFNAKYLRLSTCKVSLPSKNVNGREHDVRIQEFEDSNGIEDSSFQYFVLIFYGNFQEAN